MVTSESIDSLWPRIKPCIKQFIPTLSTIDELKIQADIKRVLKTALRSIDQSALDLAEKYILAGEADCRAATLLYQNNEVALSIYHLHQATEKAMAAFCISIGDLPIEQIERTHRTPHLLLKTTEEGIAKELSNIFTRIEHKDYRKAIRKAKGIINSDQKTFSKLPMETTDGLDIKVLLDIADELMNKQPLLEQKEEELKKALSACLPEYEDIIMAYSTMKYGQAGGQCYIFGILTYPHGNYTRYPDGYLEPKDYDCELGIVQAIPALIERTPRMFKLVREIISINKKNI